MGYNRVNKLRQIVKFQGLVLEYKNKGYSQEWIYANIVYPKYLISKATFYNWLGTNAKKELKEKEAEKLKL